MFKIANEYRKVNKELHKNKKNHRNKKYVLTIVFTRSIMFTETKSEGGEPNERGINGNWWSEKLDNGLKK